MVPGEDPPISDWLARTKQGDGEAARQLWSHYAPQLLDVARRKLRAAPRADEDEEDVVASVFESLWKGAQDQRFAELVNRCQLWGLLLCITHQKSVNIRRRASALRRGGGEIHQEFLSGSIPDWRITEIELVSMREELGRLLELLPNPEVRRVAVLKMSGCLDREIAEELEVSVRSIERKLALIRKLWTPECQV